MGLSSVFSKKNVRDIKRKYSNCIRSLKFLYFILICSFFANFLFFSEVQAFDYVVDDFNFYSIPSVTKPDKGGTITDPTFHTEITRITDSASELHSSYGDYAQPGYPKHDIENADGTKLIIQSAKWPAWHIYNASSPYEKIRDLPSALVDDKDPDVRWDATDPDVIYSTYRTRLLKYKVSTGEITVLHEFKDEFPDELVVRVKTKEEGTPSLDSRYWALIMNCNDPSRTASGLDAWYDTAIVVYDKDYYAKDSGKVISILDDQSELWKGSGFVSMSPSGNYVWTGDTHHVYPRDFSSVRALGCSNHADMAIDDEGREVIVCGKTYYKDGKTDMGVWIMMVDLETGQQTWLAPFGNGGYHISGNSTDKPGWALISIYYPASPNLPSGWADHSVYMVELTRKHGTSPDLSNHAKIWRVAHTHTVRKSYGDDPFGKINKKGTKIWFGSAWDHSYTDMQPDGVTKYPYDVFQVNLPATWHDDLSGLGINTSSLQNGMVDSAYSKTLQASGGTKPYAWTVVSGTLPQGMALDGSSGIISGTPLESGTFNFSIKLADSTVPAQEATKDYSLIIEPKAVAKTYVVADVITFVQDWMKKDVLSTADVNEDEIVDIRDLGIIMSKWN